MFLSKCCREGGKTSQNEDDRRKSAICIFYLTVLLTLIVCQNIREPFVSNAAIVRVRFARSVCVCVFHFTHLIYRAHCHATETPMIRTPIKRQNEQTLLPYAARPNPGVCVCVYVYLQAPDLKTPDDQCAIQAEQLDTMGPRHIAAANDGRMSFSRAHHSPECTRQYKTKTNTKKTTTNPRTICSFIDLNRFV